MRFFVFFNYLCSSFYPKKYYVIIVLHLVQTKAGRGIVSGMGLNLHAYLCVCIHCGLYVIPVFIFILNKCRTQDSPAARSAELNQTAVSQLKAFCLLTPEQEPISAICAEISSRCRKSHVNRGGERLVPHVGALLCTQIVTACTAELLGRVRV